MKADATEQDKGVFEEYKKILANIHQAKQSGIILPLITDDNGNRMFDFEVKSVTGQSSYDTNAIIARYNSEILTCLFADFLALGSSGSGSFSLAESKISVIEMAIESKLNEMKSQINHDLVRQLFELNGFSTDVLPEITYGAISKPSLDEVSKWIQRVSATANLPKTREVINWILQTAEIPYRVPEGISDEDLKEMLGEDTSSSGSGMVEGLNSGTGSVSGGSGDSSTSNNENANSFDVKYNLISENEDFVTVLIGKKETVFMRQDWLEFKEAIDG